MLDSIAHRFSRLEPYEYLILCYAFILLAICTSVAELVVNTAKKDIGARDVGIIESNL